MSCYESEWGTIVIPRADWSSFRKGFLIAWNEHQERLYQGTKAAYQEIKKEVSGTKGENRRKAIQDAAEAAAKRHRLPDAHFITRRILNEWKDILSPTKDQFQIVKLTGDATLEEDEASLKFRNETHDVLWEVEENNHACDTAREGFLWKTLHARLSRTTFTRGSGGQIVGNDEYHRDDREVGGGGNYVKFRWGPLGKMDE